MNLILVILIYIISAGYFIYYLHIEPINAIGVLVSFILSISLWKKRRLTAGQFFTLNIILFIILAYLIESPIAILLLLPLFQLLSVKLSPKIQTRFSREKTKVRASLSLRQKKSIYSNKHLSVKHPWWQKIKSEFAELPERINSILLEQAPEAPLKHQGENSVLNQELLQIQNSKQMSRNLTELKKRDNKFSPTEFIERVNKTFWAIQKSWYSQSLYPIQPLVSDALFEQFSCQIEEQKNAGVKFEYANMVIHESRISQINSDQNFDVIHVFIRASSTDSLLDLATNEILGENQEQRKFCEYWTFVRKPSAKTLHKPGLLEGVCPNCGSPIKIGHATVCEACRSYIRSGAYDWILAKITQASEWEYTEPLFIPDWPEMTDNDEAFNIQQIEDLSGVFFWMQRLAERTKDSKPIKRFATEPLSALAEQNSSLYPNPEWNLMESVKFGSVSLKGFKLSQYWDKVYVLLTWSGIPAFFNAEGKISSSEDETKIVRDILVLIRRHDAKTNLNIALTSAHCPNCGAQLPSTYSISCKYCDNILNEGTLNWIVERVIKENDPEYLAILQKTPPKIKEDTESNEIRSARDVLTIMAQILLADGKVEINEFDLLEKIAQNHGMEASEVNSIIYSLNKGDVFIPSPANSREAWNLMLSAAKMAVSDDELAPAEEKALNDLARHIGYTTADVERAIKIETNRRYQEMRQQAQKTPVS